jgi:uncharacterized glyoxalase superfamily protein PhnB
MSENGPKIYPFMRYQDAPAAIEFLKKAFGFEEHMIVPGENGAIVHAELRLGDAIIMPGSSRGPRAIKMPESIDDVESGIYIAVPDVDDHAAQAKAAGARIMRGPEDTEYGSREYSAVDPEGYCWSFGSYRP